MFFTFAIASHLFGVWGLGFGVWGLGFGVWADTNVDGDFSGQNARLFWARLSALHGACGAR